MPYSGQVGVASVKVSQPHPKSKIDIVKRLSSEAYEDEKTVIGDELSEAWQQYSADGCEESDEETEAFEHWREAVEEIVAVWIDEVLGELSY